MKHIDISEYNKLCLRFLGYKFDEISGTYETPFLQEVEGGINEFGYGSFRERTTHWFTIGDMKFHTDWEWIMEIKEAVCQNKDVLEFITVYDLVGHNVNIVPAFKGTFATIYTTVKPTEKEATVEALYKFLKYYEQRHTGV